MPAIEILKLDSTILATNDPDKMVRFELWYRDKKGDLQVYGTPSLSKLGEKVKDLMIEQAKLGGPDV